MDLAEMEKRKAPWGDVTLIGLGRLGLRTALNLMQAHRGGPSRITAIDEQTISPDDLIFRSLGGIVGEYKVSFLEKLAGRGFGRDIQGIPLYISEENLDLIRGDVVCIEIAGGDTLPVTVQIIRHAQKNGIATISTMGVFGVGDVPVRVLEIDEADTKNPIVDYLRQNGVKNHRLVGTGKLIRDWEPVIPPVLDRVSLAMASEVLKMLHEKRS
ncbi:ThiF family adenylyltransferase [Methanoregula sp.]|jgi:predicted ThiF/HesA family dinucleotide-utilizing enzyme|uniref:ThiF family adenylyltransferase n=1 Tax=Methanoregula sp. TaxID=2052170 RepID=UPI002633FB8F|nr:ThiF family adenylyltransferase [Methanoregula sp.]MDD5143608.1 hypothetical protein [Methanoregula sp.]